MLPLIGTTITEESLGSVVIINSDYGVSYVSPRLSELTGMGGKTVNGKFCYQLLRQRENACEDPCPLRQVMQSGELCSSHQDYLGESPGGQSFAVDCYPLRDNKNTVTQVLSILKDPAEVETAQSRLDVLYRLAGLGDLLHGLAHNVNTPLSAVIARAEMLGERVKGLREEHPVKEGEEEDKVTAKLDKCIRDAEVIVVNAMKISAIIRNMMNKRLQEEEEAPQMLSLTAVLKEELQFLEADMAFKHEIKKTYNLDESTPLIKGVYYHFSQCFTGIINTIMKSFDGSDVKELTVSSSHDDDTIYIEIHHTGLAPGQGVKECQSQSANGIWLTHIKTLLKPYNAELKISNKPNDNLYTIIIPYGVRGKEQ